MRNGERPIAYMRLTIVPESQRLWSLKCIDDEDDRKWTST